MSESAPFSMGCKSFSLSVTMWLEAQKWLFGKSAPTDSSSGRPMPQGHSQAAVRSPGSRTSGPQHKGTRRVAAPCTSLSARGNKPGFLPLTPVPAWRLVSAVTCAARRWVSSETTLCIVGREPVSLVSTHHMPAAPPTGVTTKDVTRNCHVSPTLKSRGWIQGYREGQRAQGQWLQKPLGRRCGWHPQPGDFKERDPPPPERGWVGLV